MSIRKFLTLVSATLVASVAVFGISSAALAVGIAGYTGTITLMPGTDFVQNQPSPAFTVTLAKTSFETGGNLGDLRLIIDEQGSVYHWAISSSVVASCTGTSSAMSPATDCGISSIKVNGTEVITNVHAYIGNLSAHPASLLLYFDASALATATDSQPITIELKVDAGLFQVNPGYGQLWLTLGNTTGNLTIKKQDVTPLSPATVTFNGSGGSGTMSPSTGAGSQALPTNMFSKTGSTFQGWATSAGNAARGIVTYKDGQTITYSTATLYAVWKASSGSSSNSTDSGRLPNTGDKVSVLTLVFAGLIMTLGGVMVYTHRLQRKR